MWAVVLVCLALGRTASLLQCPDGHECEGASTCCKRPTEDGYTCCDQPQFMGVSLRMLSPDGVNKVPGVVCPDGSICPLEYSCLRTSDAAFACCPWGEAISCADSRHCCHRGSHCSADGQSCFQDQGLPPPATVGAVQCPDNESECPNDSTCCMMPNGSWGCCPMPEATCCTDKIHCCPHASTCDLAHEKCLTASGDQPLQKKVPARKQALVWASFTATLAAVSRKNICPNNESTCPDITTCCLISPSQYGCCPLQNAVCCDDRRHCCPQGTTCDVIHSKCSLTPHWSWPITRLDLQKAHEVQCDAEYQCPSGHTCCKDPSGTWRCCPLEEAVCCSDHVHCCPAGYHCDVSQGRCLKSGNHIPWLEKQPALVSFSSWSRDVKCDDLVSCPDGHTCCRLASGEWGCCAFPEAVCCPDHVHCCPAGYHCDPSQGTCFKSGNRIPWLEKQPALASISSLIRVVKCDDQAGCPDGQTCCQLPSGKWGCCPFPQAVCCPDRIHCCPTGFYCDIQGNCIENGSGIPWLEKQPALATTSSLSRIVKCDDQFSCPDFQTCCRLATGQWGCCPYIGAVCCPDRIHCCPVGYYCDPQGRCLNSDYDTPFVEKQPALVSFSSWSRDVKCDDLVSCPDGHTCCWLASGEWGCCAFPEAVCCSDHIHCCPAGYHCDPSQGTCFKSGNRIPWLEKQPALASISSLIRVVKCDDQVGCPDGQTCCRLPSGKWGCCPFPQAVCCWDHVHCCPTGYHCDPSKGTCLKSGNRIPWLEKQPALASISPLSRDVKCDDEVSCPDGQTCCRLTTGEWGCCPFPEAVCCSDHVHCCPKDYTCNEGSCDMPRALQHSASLLPSRDVRCSDTTHCKEGETCCKNVQGAWSCCQLPNAVCCDDKKHCCPSGYTCNVTAQACEKRQWPSILLPSHAATSSRDLACDAQHYCRDHQTCCQAQSGGWACCPYDKGFCCADRRHCCPQGFRCSRDGLNCLRNKPLRWDASLLSPRSSESRPLL